MTDEQRHHARMCWEYGLDVEEIRRIFQVTAGEIRLALSNVSARNYAPEYERIAA